MFYLREGIIKKMKQIFVTGATGFIGKHAVKTLVKQNYQVSVLVRSMEKLKECVPEILNQLTVYQIKDSIKSEKKIEELAEFFLQRQIECVIHLATNYRTESTKSDIEGLIEGNITFGVQILEAMKLAGVKKLIYTGSSWQHYQNLEYCPVNVYAATKQAFEDILSYYTEVEKIHTIILEIYDTYGEEDTRNKIINNWKQVIKRRKSQATEEMIKLSLGEQKLDYVYIEDIVNGIIKAMQLLEPVTSDKKYKKKYALSSDTVYTLKEIAVIFERIVQITLPIEWGGKPYRIREVMEPYRGLERLPEWKAKYSLEEGLQAMFQKEKQKNKE